MAASWAAEVVGHLIDLRADGYPFEKAWKLALRRVPPDGHDLGGPRTLFDEQNRPCESWMAFFKRVAEEAYNGTQGPVGSGNGPAVRHFGVEMAPSLDESGPARRGRNRVRQVAA